jgi:hypothetical protein
MQNMKIVSLFIAALVFSPASTHAQYGKTDSLKTDSASAWSFYAEADNYLFPYEADILMLVASADHNLLHLEARYNYEDRNTASVFGGVNLTFGNQLKLLLIPIAGVAFGRTNGAIPGLELDLSYKTFDFNSQSEYLFDFNDKANDFAYTYLQLGTSLFKQFKLGLAGQRTRLYQTALDLQRGFYVGYSFHQLTATFTDFNAFTDSHFFIVALSVNF